MSFRDRSQTDNDRFGTVYRDGSVYTTKSSYDYHRCLDEVIVGDGGYFNTRHYTVTGGILNGTYRWAGRDWKVENLPPVPPGGPAGNNSVWNLSEDIFSPDDTYYATRIAAETNPSRPDVDIGVFLGELRDIPHLFKVFGDTALKTVSRANLAYWFGWRPLANDLLKIVNFSDIADKRYVELKKLYESGLSYTRVMDRFKTPKVDRGDALMHNTPAWMLSRSTTSEEKVSCHIKWRPTTLPPSNDSELRALARRVAFGLTVDPSTAWELMPWSWLVDWFSSVGDYLSLYRNLVPSEYYDLFVMRERINETRTTTSYLKDTGGRFGKDISTQVKSNGDPVYRTIIRSRSRATPGITLNPALQWLTLRQWSILGSLYVVKNRNSIRRR
uniref:Maturation protein n=1 Tax=Beihai levi-like virus 10 TaxID=1922395 RepID=A0A1L3KI04_9VIRU|nr:hypothetical protein [Beihai levi-like virus 10]